MADLDPIKQVVQIDIKEKGVTETTKDFDNLQTSITETTTANAKGNAELKKTEEGYKSLKTQLKEAIQLQQKLSTQYGSTSAEAVKASQAVASIKDEIGFQKDLVDSYNPDEKFRGLTRTAGIAALALGGVKDGLAGIGIQSEFLDKAIGGAQAILGVTSAIGGLEDAYGILVATKKAKSAADVVEAGTTEALVVVEGQATAATWSWNAALLANPIVLITAGIIAAGAAIYAYVKITGDAVKEEEKAKVASMQLSVAIDNQSKAFESNSAFNEKNNNHKIAMLKASGASEEQIYKETKALKEQEIQLGINASAEAYRLLVKAQNANASNPTEFTEKALKDAQDNYRKIQDFVDKSYNDLDSIRNEREIAIVQAQTDARKKAEEAAEKARQAQKEKVRLAREKELEDLKKFNADVLKEQQDMNVRRVEQEIQDKLDEQARKDESAQAAFEAGDRVQEELDKQKERDKISDQALVDQKEKNTDDIIATGDALIEGAKLLAGKNKAIQKAAIITEGAVSLGKVGMNIATGVSKDAASGAVASVPMIIKTIATGALSTASIITNTARALKAVGGGGGVSDGGGNSLPTRNVAQVGFQGSSENQISSAISQQQKSQPPIQAFVVSQSVTDQQELDRKKELQNSF